MAGMQYELEGVPTDGYLDFYIWPSYAEKGYLWMIPKCDGRANIGLVTEDKLLELRRRLMSSLNTHFQRT